MGARTRILIIISALALMLFTCIAVFAEDDGFAYRWDGYKCTITMPTALTDDAVLTWPDGSKTNAELTAGETVVLDLEDYVRGELETGSKKCFVNIQYCVGDGVPVFQFSNNFYAMDVELNAGKAVGKDTEFKLDVDSLKLFGGGEDDTEYQNIAAADIAKYVNWAENSIIIRKGEIAAKGRVVFSWQNDVYRGTEPIYEDGISHIIVFKLADNDLIQDKGKWGMFSCYGFEDLLFSLDPWSHDVSKLTKAHNPFVYSYLAEEESSEENLGAYLAGITKADKLVFTARVDTSDRGLF